MEDDGGGGRSRGFEYGAETNAPTASITLGGILSIKQTPPYRIHDRTLLDLIRDDPTYGKESKNTWKMLRQKLRLKLAGTVCTTALPTLASLVHVTGDVNRTATRNSTAETNSVVNAGGSTWRLNSPPVNDSNSNSSNVMNTETEIVRTETPVEEIERTLTEEVRSRGGDGDGGPAAVRMSLMSLLEFDGSSYLVDNDEDEEVDDVAVEDGGDCSGGGDNKYNNCCVCMVRHKGAAFIPCGHTFCRLCSRELFVKRASCPLCNHFIVEILDIF